MSGKYYHAHDYIHFINMVNKALNTAFNNFIRAIPKDPIKHLNGFESAIAPYLDFDTTTNRVILHAHQFSSTKYGASINDRQLYPHLL